MKKLAFFSFATLAVLLSSCADLASVENTESETNTIAAVMEGVQTKTSTTDEGHFSWTEGDNIWLETTADYVIGTLSAGAGTPNATFNYGSYFGELTGKSVYPYNEGHSVEGDVLNVVLPASYDLGSNLNNTNSPMYGVKEDERLKFNHLAGVMRFSFKNVPVGVDRFVFTVDKKINGTFAADLTADYPVLQTEAAQAEAERTVTFNFDALANTSDVKIFVPLPLGTYESLELALYKGEESVWTYSKAVTNTINRKSLKLMPTVSMGGSIGGDIENDGTIGGDIEGEELYISIAANSANVACDVTSNSDISLNSNAEELAFQALTDSPWISIALCKGSTDDNWIVEASMTENTTTENRTAQFKVYIKDNSEKYVVVEYTQEGSTVSNNKIYYTATAKVTPTVTDGFGATIISNEWDTSTKKGVITFDGDVTSIPDRAFHEIRTIKTLELPETVTSIGEYAFYNCRSLNSINIPSQVTEIPAYAFYYCNLSSIDLQNVTSIGGYAFYCCSSFTSIDLQNVTSIGQSAFFNSWKLTSIDLTNIKKLGSSAFQDCSSVTDISLPRDISDVEFGWKPFEGCTSLPVINDVRYADTYLIEFMNDKSSYSVKDGTQVIGGYAFGEEGNESVVSVTLPNTIVKIDGGAFSYCSALASVNIPEGVKVIEDNAFMDSGIKNVVLPESLIYLGGTVFSGTALESIVFPNSLTEIPGHVCYYCPNLTSVTLGNKVTHIYPNAFTGCANLTSITLPETITYIGNGALESSNLKTIYCKATTPPAVYYFVNTYGTKFECFEVSSDLKIYVPNSVVNNYKPTSYYKGTSEGPMVENWYNYRNYVYGYDF